jgi:LysM repeat protein
MSSVVQFTDILKGNYQTSLKVPAMPDKDGAAQPDIIIPLQIGESVAREEVDGSAPVTLQYAQVALQMSGEQGVTESTQQLRPGWLYIFVDGYLWHEYQITDSGRFKDVDLHTWQTVDERPAQGVSQKGIVLPTRWSNTETEVQIAISEIQWSWARICSLGGMNPEDPRLVHKVRSGETLTKIAQRYKFITSYQALADFNGLSNAGDIQIGQKIKLRDADKPIGDTEANRSARMGKPLSQQNALGGDYSTIYVQNPLGMVENFNTGLSMLLLNQQQMLAEMKGAFIPEGQSTTSISRMPYPYLLSKEDLYTPPPMPVDMPQGGWQRKDIANLTLIAQLSYATYLDTDAIEALKGKDDDTTEEIQDSLKDTGDRLSKTAVENWLRVPQRKEIRREYREIQKAYIAYCSGEVDAYEEFDHSITLESVLEDFAWIPGDNYYKLWAKVADMLNHIVIDPSNFDHQYDFKKVHEEERAAHKSVLAKGYDLVEKIYSGQHTISAWLFPNEADIDIRDDKTPEVTPNNAVTSPLFRLDDFQKTVAAKKEETESIDGVKNSFDWISRFGKVVSALAGEYKERPATKECITVLFRLMKGAGIPNLAGLHLIKRGESLNGKVPLGQYRIDRMEKVRTQNMRRHDRRRLANESAQIQKNPGCYNRITEVLDVDGSTIAAADIALLRPMHGIDPQDFTSADASSIFAQYGKTGNSESIVKASMDLWVIPEGTKWDAVYKRASQIQGTQLHSHAMTHLPKIMLLMEGIALKESVENLKNATGLDLFVGASQSFTQIINVTGAIVDVMDAWHGEDNLIKWLGEKGKTNKALKFASKTKTLSIWKVGTIKVPFVRWLGPIGNVIGAGFTAYDSYKLFRDHDYDAAMLTGVAAVLGLAGAAVGLIGGAMAGTLAASVSLMVPIIGWAIFAVSLIIMYVVNKWFKDTPSERWAEHSPFSDSHGNRLDIDDYSTIDKSLVGLQNLLMHPTAEVRKEKYNGAHRITVTVNHPGFELHQSTLDWEATIQQMTYTYSPRSSLSGAMSTTIPLKGSEKKVSPASLQNKLMNTQVTSTTFLFIFPEIPDETIKAPFVGEGHISRENKWKFKFRHILSTGISLPLDNSDFDQDSDSDKGWAQVEWITS